MCGNERKQHVLDSPGMTAEIAGGFCGILGEDQLVSFWCHEGGEPVYFLQVCCFF